MSDIKWIKVNTDIFSNRKIIQIRNMPKGDSLVSAWLQLLCLAGNINRDGLLYFAEGIPYSVKMLATELKRSETFTANAIEVFEKYKMLEEINGVIAIINWEKYQSSEKLEKIRYQNKERQRKFREKHKESNVIHNALMVARNEAEKEAEKETETEISQHSDKNIKLAAGLYNEICVSLPRCLKISEGRRDVIAQRLEAYTMEDFKSVLRNAEDSPFLKGDNNRGFVAGIDFILAERNFIKLLEGGYSNKPKKNKFCNYEQRTWDFEKINMLEREYIQRKLEESGQVII